MTEWQAIQQFEYRWQPTRDLSPIAGSVPDEAIQPWADQIARWVRHRSAGAPAESVRYEILHGGMAALAWRQRTAQPAVAADTAETRPEVSRVLVGPVQLLTPEAAIAVCRAGLPAVIGPRLGAVPVHGALPPIDPAELTGLVEAKATELDDLALNEPGLHWVIAAALTDCDRALSVQLPQRVIAGRPQQGAQAALLWGLRRTVWPLLGADSGQRGWSFSTYEPPLGEVDTGTLADIVFRTQKPVDAVLSARREILVRPHDPIGPPAAIQYQDFAQLLVNAYEYMGGHELTFHLDAVGREYAVLDERIAGVRETLTAALPGPARPVPEAHAQPVPAPSAVAPEHAPAVDDRIPAGGAAPADGIDWGQDTTWPAESGWPEDGPAAAHAGPPAPAAPAGYAASAAEPALPPDRPAAGSPPWARANPAAPPPGRSAQAHSEAPPTRGAATRPAQGGIPVPYSLSSVLDQLSAGPPDPRFEPALQYLRSGKFQDRPDDRARARRLIAERDWYLPVLLRYDSAHFDDTLEAIFRLAVIPDLDRPEVIEELARWAGEQTTPAPVIKALNAAAQGRADAPQRIRQAVEPPLGRRWLAEHGIYAGPGGYGPGAAPRRTPGVHSAGHSRAPWAFLDGRVRGDTAALLALFCVVLAALLALSLTH